MSRVLLEARNLSKAFGYKVVFKDVNVQLAESEVVLVVGNNGSGKTTFLKIASGLMQPTGGEIVRSLEPREIGFMGHETFLYSALTAEENLLFWSRLYQIKKENEFIDDILKKVGLHKAAKEKTANFSRGMAQRLSLARTLLFEPRLLLLDEPATGLDMDSQDLLRHEILESKDKGSAVIWVSHFPELDIKMADRVLVLEDQTCRDKKPSQWREEKDIENVV